MREEEEPWKRHGVQEGDDWSSMTLIRVYPSGWTPMSEAGIAPVGYVLVIDPQKTDPKWKLPGGHKERGESPLETAIREVHGETGLTIPAAAFHYTDTAKRHGRDRTTRQPTWWWDHLFVAHVTVDDIPWMNNHSHGNEGEEQKCFSIDGFWELVRKDGFLRKHLDWLVETVTVLPLGRDQATA